MTQSSPSSSSAMDVAASQHDACERMRATTNVTISAINELGHMSRHRALQSVATLQSVDRLVSDPQVQHLITADVASHLHAMQSVYFERIAAVEENASKRLISIADYMPPRSGLWATLRQFISVHVNVQPKSKALSMEDILQDAEAPVDSVERATHDQSTPSTRRFSGLYPDRGGHVQRVRSGGVDTTELTDGTASHCPDH